MRTHREAESPSGFPDQLVPLPGTAHDTASRIASGSDPSAPTPASPEAIPGAPRTPANGLQRRNRHPLPSSTVSNAALAIDATCITGLPVAESTTVIGWSACPAWVSLTETAESPTALKKLAATLRWLFSYPN